MFLTQWFVCDEATADRWCAAVAAGDTQARGEIERAFAGQAVTHDVSPVDLGLLFASLAGEPTDAAIARADNCLENLLIRDDGRHGLYVVAIAEHVTRALAGAPAELDQGVVDVWQSLANAYYEVDDSARVLTAQGARTLNELCRLSVERGLRLYGCVESEP